MSAKYKIFLVAFLLSLAIDQGSKNWVIANLTYTDRIEVVEDFFYITHVRNPGAAFGLLADAPKGVRDFLFIGVAIVAIGIIFSFQHKLAPGDRLSALALGLILGGAVGNLTDRIFHNGEVVDFLHFRLWTGYVWPDFNFADSFIVVGVGLLILELLATEGEQRNDDLEASKASSGSAE